MSVLWKVAHVLLASQNGVDDAEVELHPTLLTQNSAAEEFGFDTATVRPVCVGEGNLELTYSADDVLARVGGR